MLKKYSLKALQKAINKALHLDTQTAVKLQKLDQKILEVIVGPLDVNFFIQFNQGEMRLLDQYEGAVDTVIHSSPIGLIRLSLLPASKARSLFNDTIRITGDVELGQKVKQLFDELDIDWEGHLAHFTGDVVAFQIGSLVRKGVEFKKYFSQSMRSNMSEYLQDELRFLPAKNEVLDFFDDIDALSLRVERLQAHIEQLKGHHEII